MAIHSIEAEPCYPARMNADHLRSLATAFFRDHAAALGLDRDSLVVDYVLNWGGFVNYSFRIRDARRSYHLKLSRTAADREKLRRWLSLGPLMELYHAPPILDWIDLGPAAGLLFPFVPGQPPALHDDVVAELLPVLARLNADREIGAVLQSEGEIRALDVYLGSFHRRFGEDLHGIGAARPTFISVELQHWLEREVETLAGLVGSNQAFAEPITSPVHGDLWLNNVLWSDRKSWHLVDWDDLRIGDPAADIASLLGPEARDLRPLKLFDSVTGWLTPSQRERLPLLGRATLLDWIIDPVSDWIDAGIAPAHEAEVRAEKERIHRSALDLYKQLYR